jgi:hypothetical protein
VLRSPTTTWVICGPSGKSSATSGVPSSRLCRREVMTDPVRVVVTGLGAVTRSAAT